MATRKKRASKKATRKTSGKKTEIWFKKKLTKREFDQLTPASQQRYLTWYNVAYLAQQKAKTATKSKRRAGKAAAPKASPLKKTTKKIVSKTGSGRRARVTTRTQVVYVCAGDRRSGCGGGTSGAHVSNEYRAVRVSKKKRNRKR